MTASGEDAQRDGHFRGDRGSFERFQLIVTAPALFNAIVTGLELDVFRFLSEHPGSGFDEIGRFAGIPPHQLRVLMLALCATELVRHEDGGYTNSGLADELLAPDGPESWRHTLIGWQKIYYPAFVHMTTALRSGTNTALAAYSGTEPTLYERLAHDPETEAVLHRSMTAYTLQSMPALLASPEFSSIRSLLDVGGGDGTTGRQLKSRYPKMEVTVFDLPSVTWLAEVTPTGGGVQRVRLHPGDLFKDPFPSGHDAILFSHVLEVFSADQILTLLSKAHDVLLPEGRLFLYGFNATENEDGGEQAARLSLYLNVLATGHGMAYPASDYEGWLRQAGFRQIRSFTGLPHEHGLIVGVKS
jgi:ubiquinone/menaquinone biosynthesis C-methylase UbiE